jgi:chemotaxis protein methyltransferase CheR
MKIDRPVLMSLEEFRLLAGLLQDHCGIAYPVESKYLFSRRLASRLADLGLANFTDYYRFVRYATGGKSEMDELCDRVTTNETYFFREPNQLAALAGQVLPEIHRRAPRGPRLTLWSAGCATGEEVYTAAILVLETGLFDDWEVKVIGSDVSRRVLQVARRAVYGRSSFRCTDGAQLRRWFRPAGVDDKHQVREEVRGLCSFGHLNLLDSGLLPLVGEVDVILCRNVLMYFETPARRRAVASFHRRLIPGGYLLLGHSESLINVSTAFELCHLERDLVYRKPQMRLPGIQQ